MKIILTSDLHQPIAKWHDLVPVVEMERPQFVLIANYCHSLRVRLDFVRL
jgi:hypothetical protein